jgi:hypothetical protein
MDITESPLSGCLIQATRHEVENHPDETSGILIYRHSIDYPIIEFGNYPIASLDLIWTLSRVKFSAL